MNFIFSASYKMNAVKALVQERNRSNENHGGAYAERKSGQYGNGYPRNDGEEETEKQCDTV